MTALPTIPACCTRAVLVLLALAVAPVAAHTPHVHNYTEHDGLPSPWVADVAQATDGRIWFLTSQGTVAYDGTEWARLDLERGKLLPDGVRLRIDEHGHGWALTGTGRLYRFDEGWRELGRLDVSSACDLAVLGDVPIVAALDAGAFRNVGGRWIPIDFGGATRRVLALLAHAGTLWLATDDGLYSWSGDVAVKRAGAPDGHSPEIRGLIPAPGAAAAPRLWLAGTGWVGTWSERGYESWATTPSEYLRGDMASGRYARIRLAPDGQGGVYFGNAGGLFHLDRTGARVSRRDKDHGLIGDGVLGFLDDREGNLWIATGVGVSKLPGHPFRNLDREDGLAEDEVTAVAETTAGTLVLGHNRSLSVLRDGSVERTLALPDGGVARVLDLEPSPDGGMWVAGSGLGLFHLDAAGELRRITDGGADPDLWISSVRYDSAGRLWVAGPGGLFRLEQDRLVAVEAPVEPMRQVRRILLGPSGTLYFASGGSGLLSLRDETWHVAQHDDNAAANNVFTVLERDDGRVLVGTRAGIFEHAGERIVGNASAGFPRVTRPVYSLTQDGERLWIGTNFGVYRHEASGNLRNFTSRQGLAGIETNRAAALVDTRGRFWIGTDRGASMLDPESAAPGAGGPSVELLAAEARGEAFDPARAIRLPHDANDLTFRLRAISFVDERRIVFRTRLGGLESEWTVHEPTRTHRVVRYPRLPRGSYSFEAQASNVRGVWGPIVRAGSLEIASPFWRRGWFFGGILAGIVLLAGIAHRWTVQQRYASRLQQEVRLKTRALEQSRRDVETDRERLATVLAHIGDGVIAIDGSDHVLFSNPAAERILDRPLRMAAGHRLTEVLFDSFPDPPPRMMEWLHELRVHPARAPRACTLEWTVGDNPARSLEVAAAPYRPPGNDPAGWILALRDISERVRADQARARGQRLEALGVLAGGIAHDFNNILTTILGNISLVGEDARLDPTNEARLRDAETALGRAHRLARQLVTFSKGGEPLTRAVSMSALLEETARFVFSGSGVRYAIRAEPALRPAQADSDQIRQVFENLFLNARQAMNDTGVVEIVAANTTCETSGKAQVQIEVKDRGRGIRPEDLERIFEPYFTTKSAGSGLGLATSHSIVTRHGGTVGVASSQSGTVFTVRLPAATARPASPAAERVARPVTDRARVLILEDERAVGDVLQDMLARLGHESVVAADGDAALAALRDETAEGRGFDLAILDLTIRGGRGGEEIVGELKQSGLPSVASSGYSESRVMAEPEAFGFAAVLPKPYKLAQVGAVVATVLRDSTAASRGGVRAS